MILVRGARQLLTLRGPSPRRGMQLRDLGVIPDGSVLIDGEKIREVGSTRRIENLAAARSAHVIDATGKVVMPGFVDSHTRPLFTTPIYGELEAPGVENRATPSGAPVRAARLLQTISPKRLRLRARRWVRHFAAHGTTTIETRSGWGMGLREEMKSLRLARSLHQDPLDVVSCFLAAGSYAGTHSEREDAVDYLTSALLPALRRRKLTSLCSVACDPSGFDLEHSQRILEAARRLGFRLKVESDRSGHSGGTRLAVELGAVSIDHVQFLEPDEIDLLARSTTLATLLPALVYYRGGKHFAPARRLLDRGAAVALATGFGPDSCPALSMPTALFLARTYMRMSPEETISAATINGAASLDRAHLLGSLEPGKQADLAIFDVADYREIPHHFGVNLCVMTIKKGQVIHDSSGSASNISFGSLEAPPAGGRFGDGRQPNPLEEGGLSSLTSRAATRAPFSDPYRSWAA